MNKLIGLIADVDQMDAEDVIFVKPDWQPESEAQVSRKARQDGEVLQELRRQQDP